MCVLLSAIMLTQYGLILIIAPVSKWQTVWCWDNLAIIDTEQIESHLLKQYSICNNQDHNMYIHHFFFPHKIINIKVTTVLCIYDSKFERLALC